MTRSKTIFSALLCSVSFISLTAQAAPSAVTDWHVAPVLSPGSNSMPYCALATNYPDAGIIVTHARNKHGTGTIAFDFQDGEFEADQYYGIEVSFDNMTRTFAAQARNNHLLVVEMAEDHPLYAALNAGQDLTVAVQNGGPSVTLAGNSRPFFQLNYCVQALNDDAAAEVIVQRPNNMPSFGLQQLSTAPILTPPAVRPKPLPVEQPQPHIAQAAAQDGDASRAELENMLDKARSNETKPARQKLSSISSNDEIDPASVAPVSRNARQSLLFDDPTAANAYVPPKLSDVEKSTDAKNTKTSVKSEKPAPLATPKTTATSKPMVTAAPVAAPAPVKKEIAKTAPVPAPLHVPVASKAPTALPNALPLPQDETVLPPPVKAEIKSDKSRTILASDYATEQQTGIAAKSYTPDTAKTTTAKTPVAVKPAPAVPNVKQADITWDTPVAAKTENAAPAGMTTPATVKTVAKAEKPKKIVTPKVETAKTEPAKVEAKVDAAPVTENIALAAPAPVIEKPVIAKAVVPEKKIAPEATIARAEAPVMPPVMPAAQVMPAPALPPAYVAEEPINNSVRGPMKRADEVIAVSFPEDETNDGEILNAPLPQATMVVAQNNTTPSVPAALLQSPAPGGAINFNPPPSKTSLPWDVSATGNPGEGGFCVMKNRFQNQQNLFLSRGTDGSATLGIDYGMDLLQVNRDYKTTIQLDHLFTEDFTGEARQANLLVVQMGRKDSFFDALRQAKALHIALDGSASTFDVKGIAEKIPAFNSCMVSQGGVKLPEATPVAVAAPVAAIAPAPVAKAVTNNSLPAPKTTAEIKAATTGVKTMVTPQAAPVLAAAPSAVPSPTPAPAAPVAMSLTTAQVNALLAQSHITGTVRAEGANYKWGGVSDAVQGTLSEQRFAAGKEDLLEGVMRDIDASEKMCGGEFASEIGIPEQHGNMEALPTESSCTTNGDKIVSASLYQRVGQIFRVWTQKSSQSNRDLLVSQRDRLANIVLKD